MINNINSKIDQLNQDKISANYNQTTIGILPKDWGIIPLRNIIDKFIVPMRDKPKNFDGDIPWCRIEDIQGKYLNNTLSNKYVSLETVDKMNLKIHPKDTVICSCSARLGVCAITTQPVITNQTFIGLVPSSKVNKEFLYYLMVSNENRLQRLSSGTTIAYLSREEFEGFKVQYPKIIEQEKIANILSTWDNAIELKEKLIEQKRVHKKGLMQSLLTGKKRLKGFTGEWKIYKLGEIIKCLDNKRKPLNSSERGKMKGNIPYYGANGIVDYINSYIFHDNLILLAEDGGHFNEYSARPIALKVSGKCWVNNHAHILKVTRANTNFLFYSLVHKDIRRYINGSTRAKLLKSDMLLIKIKMPKDYKEQEAISNIILTADKEILLLEQQLNQLKLQKKGLMQLLLTGIVRVTG